MIAEARVDDSGVYTCQVTNVIGSAVSAAKPVTVAEPGLVVFTIILKRQLSFV